MTNAAVIIIFGTIIHISCSLICLRRGFISVFFFLDCMLATSIDHSLPGFNELPTVCPLLLDPPGMGNPMKRFYFLPL